MNQLNLTTFEESLSAHSKIEVGDKNSTDFKPSFVFYQRDGECFLNVELLTDKRVLPKTVGEKVRWEDENIAVDFYSFHRKLPKKMVKCINWKNLV
jgi:hypothetical protein